MFTQDAAAVPGFTARLREFIATGVPSDPRDAAVASVFDELALNLFSFQYARSSVLRQLCHSRGLRTQDVRHWAEIPAIPSAAFKEMPVTCLPEAERQYVFHSSRTTGQAPSSHFHSAVSLHLYEASLTPWFGAHLCAPDVPGKRWPILSLVPGVQDAAHSSLAHMCEVLRRRFGAYESRVLGKADIQGLWEVDADEAISALTQAQDAQRAVLILGTAFLLVRLLERLEDVGLRFNLPAGTRLMETGGYKGRSRVLSRGELREMIDRYLGIPASHVVSEYGMTELGSQAYDRQADGPEGPFRFPHWARVRIVSPETGSEVSEGEIGAVTVVDLANAFSAMAVQTEDLGVRRGNGFELIGRVARSEPRGCALMSP